jgi:tetratricopeptide (TPR) repeat protein
VKKLKAGSFIIVLFLVCSFVYCPEVSAKESLAVSIENLDFVEGVDSAMKRQEKSEVDEKLMKAIAIIDEMEKNKKWKEVGKLVEMEDFKYSNYYDELLYIYIAHLANEGERKKVENLWLKMSRMQNSIHVFPAMLIRFFSQKDRKSSEYKKELDRVLEYIDITPKGTLIHGPMISGNFLFGYSVREDFSSEDPIAVHTMEEYVESPKPLKGFSDDTQYLGILEASNSAFGVQPLRTAKLAELYDKSGDVKKAAEYYYELSKYHFGRNQHELSKKYIEKALEGNKDYKEAQELEKEIDLALVLKSKEEPVLSKSISASKEDSYLVPPGKKLTRSDLAGKSKETLRLMRNEIFARYGRPFRSDDLHEYFTKKSWYKVNPNYSDDLLNSIDRHNILLIREVETGN